MFVYTAPVLYFLATPQGKYERILELMAYLST